jgi:hypothetical protein
MTENIKNILPTTLPVLPVLPILPVLPVLPVFANNYSTCDICLDLLIKCVQDPEMEEYKCKKWFKQCENRLVSLKIK